MSALATVMVVMLGGTAAHAEPSVAEVEKQIDEVGTISSRRSRSTTRRARSWKKKKKQADALGVKIEPLKAQVDAVMGRVGAIAAEEYKTGPASELGPS